MTQILCRNCKSELPSALEMLKAIRCAHAVFYLIEKEIGELGYGASRVAEEVKRIVRSYENVNEKESGVFLDPIRTSQAGYCTCENGLTSAGCPFHSDGI